MSWTQANASKLEALITETEFLQELDAIKPPLGGPNTEERANAATKREMWEELIDKLKEMSRFEPEQEEESDFIDVSKADPK